MLRHHHAMKPKSAQLQIRVTAAQKAAIRRFARQAGLDMSAYVLGRVLPPSAVQFARLVAATEEPQPASYGLAELNSFLKGLTVAELHEAVAAAPEMRLAPYVANYIAAMVEYACQKRGLPVPAWVGTVEPLSEPVFATALQSLRLHLLTHSPPPFRRRNIFIDSSLGDRV
jgi:hypothetical protein